MVMNKNKDRPANARPRILVVEDEWLIAEDFGDILNRAGFEIVGPANTAAEADELIRTEEFSAALLDVNLGSGTSFSLADKLDAEGIPYAYITGYNNNDLPDHVKAHALLSKPVADDDLPRVVNHMIRAREDA